MRTTAPLDSAEHCCTVRSMELGESTEWSSDRLVRHYDVSDNELDRLLGDPSHFYFDRAVARLVQGGDSLLDVGCAVGSLKQLLERRSASVQYTGVDLTPEFIARARQKWPGARFEVASATELPFADSAFDVAVSKGTQFVVRTPTAGVTELLRVSRRAILFDLMAHVGPRGSASGSARVEVEEADRIVDVPGRGQVTLFGTSSLTRMLKSLAPHRTFVDVLDIGLDDNARASAHPAYARGAWLRHLWVTVYKDAE